MESRDVASQPIDPLILALSFLGNRNSAEKEKRTRETRTMIPSLGRMGKKLENLVVNIGRGPKRWGILFELKSSKKEEMEIRDRTVCDTSARRNIKRRK